MGGLAFRLIVTLVCSKNGKVQKSYLPKQFGLLFWINQLYSQHRKSIASGKPQDTLLIGKPLSGTHVPPRALSTKDILAIGCLAKRKTLGMVKMTRIGQSACLRSLVTSKERAPETERVSVKMFERTSRLKIQSILLGKPRSIEIPTKYRIYYRLFFKLSLKNTDFSFCRGNIVWHEVPRTCSFVIFQTYPP